MADSIKVLGQVDAAATTEADLYTVPDLLTQTTCSSIIICNRNSSSITFRVSVSVADAATTDKDYLFYDTPLGSNATLSAILGMTLQLSDTIRVYASTTGVSFNLFGVETS